MTVSAGYLLRQIRAGLNRVFRSAWRRRWSPLAMVVGVTMLCPMALAPGHPVAVYGYLASMGMTGFEQAPARSYRQLRRFLLSDAQVARYQADLRDDMMDPTTGKLFVIARRPDGTFAQFPIRTWNGFLPRTAPRALLAWSDCKEIPFLGDEVAVWSQGYEIVAHGHYHAFGSPPSRGDRLAQRFSEEPEIVVSNDLVPTVYLNGKLVPYGSVSRVPKHVWRLMRCLDTNRAALVSGQDSSSPDPSKKLRSFLGYLQDHYGTDINRTDEISSAIRRLVSAYRARYGGAFASGIPLRALRNDPNTYHLATRLYDWELWALLFKRPVSGVSQHTAQLQVRDYGARPVRMARREPEVRAVALERNHHARHHRIGPFPGGVNRS